jgi:membrane-bound serine protease (ClpP class)
MNGRLIMAIISTLLEETALAVIVLWGFPQLSVRVPLAGLIVLMVAWGILSIVIYRAGSRALMTKPLVRLPDMVGSKGKVVSPLDPEGLVRIKGELWVAKSASGEMNLGEEVIVVGQEGLKLVVQRSSPGDLRVTK